MHLSSKTLELLNGGDWACAEAQHETLAHVARQLGERLEGAAARMAGEIADEAITDLSSATAKWSRLAALLRYGDESFERGASLWGLGR